MPLYFAVFKRIQDKNLYVYWLKILKSIQKEKEKQDYQTDKTDSLTSALTIEI